MPEPFSATNPPSQDTSLPLLRAHRLLGSEENMKLLFDRVQRQMMGDESDTILNRDLMHSRARLDIRSERNAVAFDRALATVEVLTLANLVAAAQTGDTTEQTANGPEHTAEGAEDTANAVVSTGNAAIAASIGDLALSVANLITATGGTVTVQTLAALLPTIVAAAGAASNNAGGGATK